MKVSTFTSRAFNQRLNDAKRAAEDGPVFITKRGTPEHVLLKVEDYQRLHSKAASMAQLLAIQSDTAQVPGLSVRKAKIKSRVPQFD